MAQILQKRKTLNNDDEYLVINVLNEESGKFETAVVNLSNGVARITSESEIDERLPVIIEN